MTTETPEKRDIATIVGECAGAVSACWSNLEAAGTFDSTQAKKHVEDALAEIAALDKQPGTTALELNFSGVRRDGVEGDASIKVTYPDNKAMLAIVALAEAGKSNYGAQLATALQHDHSVAEALAAAGISAPSLDTLESGE